jgi:outer membrane protein
MKMSRHLFRPIPIALAIALSLSSHVQAQSLVELFEVARGYDATFIAAKAQYEANLAKANQTLGGYCRISPWVPLLREPMPN